VLFAIIVIDLVLARDKAIVRLLGVLRWIAYRLLVPPAGIAGVLGGVTSSAVLPAVVERPA
jgi:hypothetical protein